MSKITRRSYKRKKIIMGAALFGAVGLVSTGFAAWVLSASATDNQSATLKVGEVSDKSMTFQNVKIYGIDTEPGSTTLGTEIETSDFSFNPAYTDDTGRVRFGRGDANSDVGERLSLIIRGEVTEAQNLGSMTIEPKTVPTALATAETAGYIVVPDCLKSQQTVTYTVNTVAGVSTATFSYTVAFEWGATFGGVNPSVYYDSAAGSSVSIADVNTTLTALHTLLDTVEIEVTLTANPN